MGVDGAGNEHLAAAGHGAGRQCRLGQGGGPVVEGGVGRLHAGKAADEGLVLKNRLQQALADLGLVRGVSGVKLAPPHHVLHHGGDEVIVDAGAEEAGMVLQVHVLRRQRAQMGPQLHLRERRRQLKPVFFQADLCRQFVKELLHRGGADGGQHLPPLRVS